MHGADLSTTSGLSVGRSRRRRRRSIAARSGSTPQFAFELEPHPIRGVMLRHPSGLRLELFEHAGVGGRVRAAASPIEALATRGYGHFALAAPDIDAVFAAALGAGARPRCSSPAPSPEPGVRFAFLADPEGNLVELVERA